VTHLVILPVE
jgi:hypothetical protein